jgi:hypothetical protein
MPEFLSEDTLDNKKLRRWVRAHGRELFGDAWPVSASQAEAKFREVLAEREDGGMVVTVSEEDKDSPAFLKTLAALATITAVKVVVLKE